MGSWSKYHQRKQREQLKRELLTFVIFIATSAVALCCIDVLLRR